MTNRPWTKARPLAPARTLAPANDNAPPTKEWRLQAAAVRRLRARPDFNVSFTLAGDMNAGKRGPQAIVQAKATGLTAGDPDLRIYGSGGRLLLIEYKTASGKLTKSQKDRHPVLAKLGHPVSVIASESEQECADQTEALLERFLKEPLQSRPNGPR